MVFTADPAFYKAKAKYSSSMTDETGTIVGKDVVLVQESFPFFAIVKNFPLAGGGFDTLDVAVIDDNGNGSFDLLADRVLFGSLNDKNRWVFTVFTAKFLEEPLPNDVYFATFYRPFFETDSLTFEVLPSGALDEGRIASSIDLIKVVPNPYVATNSMEPVVGNWYLNQRRKLLFTHLPAQCSIKIFTASGIPVDEIEVDNDEDNGTVHWDLLSDEGLDVAAGIYIYHVKARRAARKKSANLRSSSERQENGIMKSNAWKTGVVLTAILLSAASSQAQKPFRRGTTSGNFLEFGYGAPAMPWATRLPVCRMICPPYTGIRPGWRS